MKTIIHVTYVHVPRERAFEALTTIAGLAGWWTTKVDGDAGPNGLIDFTFGGDFNPDMRVTAFEAPSMVEWRCVGGVEQWTDNKFQFELEEGNQAALVRFRQDYATELSDDDYGIYNYNWGYYLASLCAYLETGHGKPFQAGS